MSKHVVVIAGPNGAGKSTCAPALLRDVLGIAEFVNADTIAAGLAAFAPDRAALAAGRVMLERLRSLAEEGVSFAFETTLATRSYARWLQQLKDDGYEVHVVFLWLPSPDLAVARVRERVSRGGHDIPEETVRRRYDAGLRNFFGLYVPLASKWRFIDNSSREPSLVAADDGVVDATAWDQILARVNEGKP